ncbi:MAG: tetratricopeptide repeat protein [Pseudomonadota bacterium]
MIHRSLQKLVLPISLALTLGLPSLAAAQGTAGPYMAAQQAERRGDVAAAARFYSRTLARDGENAQLLERAMLNQLAAGNIAEGIALARRQEALNPGHHLGVLALAADALQKPERGRVAELLGEGGPFVGQVIKAWALFADDQLDAAIAELKRLETSDANGRPGQIVGATHLGLILAASGDDSGAIEAFERATGMSEGGGSLRLVEAHARALARLGRAEDAATLIGERLAGTFGDAGLERLALEIAAGDVPAPSIRSATEGSANVLYGVARLLARGQNRAVSLAYAQIAVYLDPSLTSAQLLLAQIFDASGQYEQAIAAFEAIPADAPETLSAMIGRAEALQISGSPDAAVEAMRATVTQFPDSLEANTSLGDLLRRESRFEEAATAYDGAIGLIANPEQFHWALFYRRGIALERSKQWERAESDFRFALELQPDQADVLNYLGYSLVELGMKLPEAEEMIEKAVEQRPDDGYIVDSLGWILYRFGEFDRAVEQLERAVELRPVDPVINDHFGDALWMVGRRIEARFQWKRALSFEPEDKDAKRIREKLDVGLDKVLAREREEGLPGIIGRHSENDAGSDNASDGG